MIKKFFTIPTWGKKNHLLVSQIPRIWIKTVFKGFPSKFCSVLKIYVQPKKPPIEGCPPIKRQTVFLSKAFDIVLPYTLKT